MMLRLKGRGKLGYKKRGSVGSIPEKGRYGCSRRKMVERKPGRKGQKRGEPQGRNSKKEKKSKRPTWDVKRGREKGRESIDF